MHAVARRQPGMQRLDHRPEVLLQAGRLGRGDRERVSASAVASSPSSAADGRGGADRPERGRAVPAALIVARIHRAAEPRFDLESDDVGVEQRAAGGAGQLRRREHRRHQRRARMRERDEAHVVVVERVRGGAVGERRVRARSPRRGARDDDTACAPARLAIARRLDDAARRLRRAGERARRPCRGAARPRRHCRRAARASSRAASPSCSAAASDARSARRRFRLADGRHEALLDEHAVERRLHRRRRLRRPWRRSPRARLARRARSRRRTPPSGRTVAVAVDAHRARRRLEVGAVRGRASAGRRSSRIPRCPRR